MAYQASGRLHKIFDTEQKSQTFQAREFVIESPDDRYPQMIKFQLVQDKCDLIDGYSEGEDITVAFDLRGREWNGKYFTNLQAWRITRGAAGEQEGSDSRAATATGGSSTSTSSTGSSSTGDFDDDIPF